MRILMIADCVYPDAAGGTWNYTYEVARRMAKRGHRVVVVAEKVRAESPDQETREGFEVVRFRRRRGGHMRSFLSRLWEVRRALNKALANDAFDLLVIQSVVSGAAVFLTPGARKLPRLITFHGTGARSETESTILGRRVSASPQDSSLTPAERVYLWGLDFVEKWVLRSGQKISVPSTYGAGLLQSQHGIRSERLSIIPIGVDTERFCPADAAQIRTRLGWPVDVPILLTVRRLIPRMGLLQLIDGMALVVQQRPDALLMIGGKGILADDLAARIRSLGLERKVKLLGFIEESDLPLHYQAADLFVLPTLELEGFGMVTLEALSCGTPVLGTRTGATPEVLGPLDLRLLVPKADAASLAEGILSYLEVNRGPARPAIRQYVEGQYSWEKVIPRLEEVYSGVAGIRPQEHPCGSV